MQSTDKPQRVARRGVLAATAAELGNDVSYNDDMSDLPVAAASSNAGVVRMRSSSSGANCHGSDGTARLNLDSDDKYYDESHDRNLVRCLCFVVLCERIAFHNASLDAERSCRWRHERGGFEFNMLSDFFVVDI